MLKRHIVEKYTEGFRTGDQAKVLSCLTEDVIWRVHGCSTYNGKAAFAAEIMNDAFSKMHKLEIRELIQEGDRIVAVGSGTVILESGLPRSFVFSEVFLLNDKLIKEIDTFHIWTDIERAK